MAEILLTEQGGFKLFASISNPFSIDGGLRELKFFTTMEESRNPDDKRVMARIMLHKDSLVDLTKMLAEAK